MLRRIAAVWSGESELDYRGGAVLVAGSGIMFSFTGVLFRAIESATDWQFLLVRAAGALTAMLVITVLLLSAVTWLTQRDADAIAVD